MTFDEPNFDDPINDNTDNQSSNSSTGTFISKS